jgi:radical SAM protein with 4Fe4S-binding SPASM domain
MDTLSRGCLAGVGFCFVSHVGDVQPCGYFDRSAGNVREESFGDIWRGSRLFADLRDLGALKGKCGVCDFKRVCGGCRARAYERTGDYLSEEPYCAYMTSGWPPAG